MITFDLSDQSPAADRDARQKLIALFDALDALDELDETTSICLWAYKHPQIEYVARVWAAARSYRIDEDYVPSDIVPGYVHHALTVYRDCKVLFTVRLDTPAWSEQ